MGAPTTAVCGPVLVTFSCGAVICVVAQFSARKPSAVVATAQLVTGPTRVDLNTASTVCAWPACKAPSVQTSSLPSRIAGGCERTYSNPSGMPSWTVISRDSTLPMLVTEMVKGTSAPTAAFTGPVLVRDTCGPCHSFEVSPRPMTMPEPLGVSGSGGRMISTAMRLTPDVGLTWTMVALALPLRSLMTVASWVLLGRDAGGGA